MSDTPMIQSTETRGWDGIEHERVVWVLHQPTNDRRTKRKISLDEARSIPAQDYRVLLPPTATVDRYAHYARALFDALVDFEDGDVIVSMGGDLHTVTMVDDLLRQRDVAWYCWAKHTGHGNYVLFEKSLDCTNFADDIAGPSDA